MPPDLQSAAAPRREHAVPATAREREALVYLAAADGPVEVAIIGRDLGDDPTLGSEREHFQRGRHILHRLSAAGLLSNWRGAYSLTETGRVAAALVMLREPGMREAFFDD